MRDDRQAAMFWHSPDFPCVRHLEAGCAAIRAEADALALEDFADWPETDAYSGAWKVFGLASVDPHAPLAWTCATNARRCPRTLRHLGRIRGLLSAGFSLLLPGAHIHAHVDEIDERLRAHLALRVNPDAGLRVGNETLRWSEGRCLVFDPRVTHEAANLGSVARLVLLLDLERSAIDAELGP